MTSILDPEDYDAPSSDRPGKVVKKGFQDKSGSLPRSSYWNTPDVNRRARGRVDIERESSSTKTAKKNLQEAQVAKSSVAEPLSKSQSLYPYNKVIETESGHVIENDDTPGAERLRVQHRTGSQVEFLPDGSVRVVGTRDRYTVVAGKDDLVVRGTCNIVVESDATIRVQGDMTTQVDGDYNLTVQGDMNEEIRGSVVRRVHGDSTQSTTGYHLEETRGNVEKRHLSNYTARVVGTSTTNVGDAYSLTGQSTANIVFDDQLTAEFEGGYLDIKAGYLHGTTAYFTNYHAESNFYGTQVHASVVYADNLHGTLEGTAKSSQYATTAGAAPLGSAAPTTPSPTSPTDATDAPESDLSATEVDKDNETSQEMIKELDRSTVNGGFNTDRLDTYKVVSRSRNSVLRRNSEWLQDQVNTGAINQTITSTSGSPRTAAREATAPSQVGSGLKDVSTITESDRNFAPVSRMTLRVVEPESKYDIGSTILPCTQLSPNFFVSHFLGADSDVGDLSDTGSGVSLTTLAQNMQLVAYNVLEPMRMKYRDNFTISEGLYTLFPNETVDSSSINVSFMEGLAVGVQFPDRPNSFYYDAATWALNHLVFDKIILSYIDYDPSNVNEPTLIIAIKNGTNSRNLSTEWNHQEISSTLQDLSDT